MNLKEYIEIEGWGSQQRLADAVGVYSSDVSDWKLQKCSVPVRYCLAIEKATGGAVTRQELRPDDWKEIWQE